MTSIRMYPADSDLEASGPLHIYVKLICKLNEQGGRSYFRVSDNILQLLMKMSEKQQKQPQLTHQPQEHPGKKKQTIKI